MQEPPMNILLNGKTREVGNPASLDELLAGLGVAPGNVAVECDGVIVPRDRLTAEPVRPGACVEIIHFVGGG